MSLRLPCTPTEAAVVIDALPMLVRRRMSQDGLSLRGVAKDAGVSFSTVARLLDSKARDPSLRCAVSLLRWLDAPADVQSPMSRRRALNRGAVESAGSSPVGESS